MTTALAVDEIASSVKRVLRFICTQVIKDANTPELLNCEVIHFGHYLPVELVRRLINREHPVRIWREHRGLTLGALAKKAAVPSGYLSEIENRKKPGSVAAFRRLSRALKIPIDSLVP